MTPGPSRFQLLRDLPRVRRGLVQYLRTLADRYGETVFLPLGRPTYILGNPADIKHILVTNPKNYHKAGGLTVGRELFGSGLASCEPPLHTRQRRLMQPMFHGSSIAKFAELMTRAATDQTAAWRDGGEIDLAHEMVQTSLAVVGRALFSMDLGREGFAFGSAFIRAERLITRRQRLIMIPLWVPTPTNLQYRAAIRQIDEAINEIISTRRRLPEAERPQDLLTMLLAARFDDGSAMPERQLRDEMVTLMLAGNETVADSLTWTWLLLSQHPAEEAALVAEWNTVLGGRTPTLADVPSLSRTQMVLAESMRLYPPAWTLARRVVKDDTLPSGVTLPAGAEVLMVQYVCHRNAKYFPDPDRFDPERFRPDAKPERPPYAYFPFGGGPRYCIGESFARLEAPLLLATIGQRFHLEVVPNQNIVMEPMITLRPRDGLRVIVRERKRGGKEVAASSRTIHSAAG